MKAQEARSVAILSKSRYVFPNVITALSLVMGLISCFYSFHGQYVAASWVIMYSTILDKLDGSTARALKASSSFGVQFDSFSDFIAFGVAPVFLVFSICSVDPQIKVAFESKETPFFLYVSLIFFVLTSAMRLARFNVTTKSSDRYMIGMATTGAGALVASYVLAFYSHLDFFISVQMLQWLPMLLLLLGALQISNLPILKVGKQKSKFAKRLELTSLLMAVVCIATRSLPELLLISGTFYFAFGFCRTFRGRKQILGGFQDIEGGNLGMPTDADRPDIQQEP